MPSKEPIARPELVALTGMTDDIMTFWSRHDLIRPVGDRGGRGKRFRYPYYEVNIGAIMLQLREFGSNIEVLKGVSSIYREALEWKLSLGLTTEEVAALCLIKANEIRLDTKLMDRESDAKSYHEALVKAAKIEYEGSRLYYDVDLTDRVKALSDTIDADQCLNTGNALLEIMAQPTVKMRPSPTFFWKAPNGWKRAFGEDGQSQADADGALATLTINITGVLYKVWNQPCDG